jgi:hypothetical protein
MPIPAFSLEPVFLPALSNAVYSLDSPLLQAPTPTPARTITFDAPKWRRIPQVVYDQGNKQWNFKQAESIVFEVDGYPGVNMADALRERPTGLKNRDDLMLQDARQSFSCRLQVGFSSTSLFQKCLTTCAKFPGYPTNKSPQVRTLILPTLHILIARKDLYQVLEEEPRPHHTQ